ncbi:MAG: AmmeMemoRadiSam system protein B [Patescibacteria group bacterium]
MKKGLWVAAVMIIAIIVVATQLPKTSERVTRPIFSVAEIDGIEMVYAGVGTTNVAGVAEEGAIRAAVLPHHTLLGEELDGWWAEMAKTNPKPSVIVLIGPNHENAGTADVQITSGVWTTPFGDVATDDALVDYFLKTGPVGNEPASFVNEHAIGTHAPYIAHWFPGVPIVPVIAKSGADQDDATAFERQMQDLLPEDALVIASIDFCHYLTEEETAKMDVETLAYINARDYDHIATLHSDHLDAPFAMITYLLWADHHNYRSELIYHSSSHSIFHEPFMPGTSYLVYTSH